MENRLMESCACGSVSDARLAALSSRFASRGLAKSVLQEAREQIAAEEQTRAMAPCSYRLSLLSDATVDGYYRCGKETMSGEDLLRYVEESREIRAREKDFSECVSVYESATLTAPLPVVAKQNDEKKTEVALSERISSLPRNAVKTVVSKLPLWFDLDRCDRAEKKRAFPLSSLAAILAIAVSMMLIVTSALMVAGVETEISELNSEISSLEGEVKDLEADLESRSDLLEIRRIAVEEYGMVEGDCVKIDQISLESVEKTEAFEKERSREIGLAAILSAIGWKK